jgi:hypothetical protein
MSGSSAGLGWGRWARAVVPLMFSGFVVASCGGSEAADDGTAGASGASAKAEQTSDTRGSTTGGSDSNASAAGALGDGCELVSTTSVGWTEQTDFGAPSEVFGALAGSCEAPFSWDGSGWSDMATVDPATGQSTISATVEVDKASARWVEQAPEGSTLDSFCEPVLEVDGKVTLELTEGTIVRAEPVTIAVDEPTPPLGIVFSLNQGEFGNWVSVETQDETAQVTMSVEMMPVSDVCTGNVTLSVAVSQGGRGMGAGQSGFAQWSETGCGVGQYAVDLDETYEGVDLPAAVQDAFDGQRFDVTWQQDGKDTKLDLALEVAETDVCAEDSGLMPIVVLPVDIELSTADGLVDLSGRGTVRASVEDGVVQHLELWMSADFACQSEADTLPYDAVDCAGSDSMTAQFGLNYSPDGIPPYTGGELLYLYVHPRDSTSPSGAFDRVDELELSE